MFCTCCVFTQQVLQTFRRSSYRHWFPGSIRGANFCWFSTGTEASYKNSIYVEGQKYFDIICIAVFFGKNTLGKVDGILRCLVE